MRIFKSLVMKTALLTGALVASAVFAETLVASPVMAQDLQDQNPAQSVQDQGLQEQGYDAPVTISGDHFYWNDVGGDGPISIVVSVPQQVAYVYRGDVVIGVTSVSTGKPGHETPIGAFTILQKQVDHHSNLYDDASMPFMERLTWDGVALHAGRVVNRPASHGCVRLPLAFAKRLYGVTALGAAVTITDDDISEPAEPTQTASIAEVSGDR